MATSDCLTAERLRKLMTYCPETGLLRRLKRMANQPVGAVAGCLCKTHGYIVVGIDYQHFYAHRLAFLYMNGTWPSFEIDHRNRIKDDNRWANLRPALHTQNSANSENRLPNTSGFRGIVWVPRSGKWMAKAVANGRQHYFGSYDSAIDAAKAYDRGAISIHGEFAFLNFPVSASTTSST